MTLEKDTCKITQAFASRLDSVEKKVSQIHKAFPDGDIEGHKRYHETMIEMLAERRRLRVAVQEKTISGLVWSGIVLISAAIMHYLKRG